MITERAKAVVATTLACSLAACVAKLVAAAVTGSAALLSGAMQSLVDASSQALLLQGPQEHDGQKTSRSDCGSIGDLHFWALVVPVLLLAMGAGVSLAEGLRRIIEPRPITSPLIGALALAISLVLAAASARKAMTAIGGASPDTRQQRSALLRGECASFTVLVEGLAAMAGAAAALGGIGASSVFGLEAADGIAALIIGLVMAATAAYFALQVKRLPGAAPAGDAVAPAPLEIISAGARPDPAASPGQSGKQPSPHGAGAPRSSREPARAKHGRKRRRR